MIVRAAAERPVVFAVGFLDRQVVDACMPMRHEARFVELPVLVAIAAKPAARIVVPLVGKAHGDAVFGKGPQFLDEPIVQLARPLALQELANGFTPNGKFGAVAPARGTWRPGDQAVPCFCT